jgi:hypothetical protein
LRWKIFAIFNAAIGALVVSFMVETLILRVVYSSLFFVVLYLLQSFFFDLKTDNDHLSKCSKIFLIRKTNSVMFVLGLLASIAIVVIPVNSAFSNAQFSTVLLNLSPLTFLRVLLGLFLLSIFPGYVVNYAFLSKSGLDAIEKIGVVLALSFGVNAFLGLILLRLGGLTIVNLLLGMWIFVTLVIVIRTLRFRRANPTISYQSSKPHEYMSYLTLFVVFAIMLFSSYAIVVSSGTGSLALGGDIGRYIAVSTSLTSGITPIYLSGYSFLLMFISVAQHFTGLHIFASYVSLEFLVLLVPCSFYLLLKSLFPEDRKTPVIGAVLISITSGLSSIGIFDFLSLYSSGSQNINSALSNLSSTTALGTFDYQFYVMPLSYSLIFLSLAFSYKYCCRGRKLTDLLLCGLFAVIPLYTHSIFEFSVFIATVIVFLLFSSVKNSAKALIAICLSILLIFIPFEITTGVYTYTLTDYLFSFTSVFGYTNFMNLVKFPLLLLLVVVPLIVFLRRRKSSLPSIASEKVLSLFEKRLFKIVLWVFAIGFFILTIYFWRLNWSTFSSSSAEWLPQYWYITILAYGITPFLIIVTLPYIVKRGDSRSLLFIFSLLFTVFLLASLSLFMPNFFPPAVWGKRWLSFVSYPLIGLASLGLSSINFTASTVKGILLKFNRVKIRFSSNKMRDILTIFLILAISFSFLSYAYSVEYFQSAAYTKSVSDSEANVYNWILKNTPENSVILTATSSSAQQLESIACRPSFGYSDASTSWPLQALFSSCLPETLLYSLKELGVSYIFITPDDASFLATNLQDTYLTSLLNVLPIAYKNGNVTLYAAPNYPLYQDSNYVLVSPTIDLLNMSTTQSSLALYDDFSGNLSNWTVISGNWTTEQNELCTSGKDSVANWCTIVSNQSFSNFIYEYKAKSMVPPNTAQYQYIWGIFRYVDANNYYSYYLGNTTYFIYETLDGVTSTLASGHLPATLNLTQWNSVKVEAEYSTITLYVNDNLITTMQGTGQEGKVGFEAYTGYPTCYGDVNVTSLILPVDSKSALSAYQTASNMLIAAEVNFTVMSDVNLAKLQTGNVYVFPYNAQVPESLLSNLQTYISQGANVIFLDSQFGSFDELDSPQNSVLSSILQVNIGATSACSAINFANEQINLSSNYTIQKLISTNSDNLIIANYTLNNQTVTPYIIQKQIGAGTLSFINMADLINSANPPVALNQDILNSSLRSLMPSLPKPVQTKIAMTSPLPQGLYKFTECNDIPQLLANKDIYNYIYVYGSPITLNGSCIVESDYALMTMEQTKISELDISNATYNFSVKNETFSYISLKGSANISIETNYLSFSPSYSDSLIKLTFPTSITIHVSLINAELQLNTSDSNSKNLLFTSGNLTITIPNAASSSLNIALNQPTIKLNGTLNLSAWQGIFWYGDKAIIGWEISPEQCVISGNLSLQPMYSFGGVQIKVEDVQYIKNVEQ